MAQMPPAQSAGLRPLAESCTFFSFLQMTNNKRVLELLFQFENNTIFCGPVSEDEVVCFCIDHGKLV